MAMNEDPVSVAVKPSRSDDRLYIQYTIHNGRPVPIFVLNRPWRGASERGADAEGVYRFVIGRGLRLLLGSAPLPRSSVTFRNRPEMTRIEPFATVEGRIDLAVPVTEYNVYFSKASPEERVAEKVDQVELFVAYVEATSIEAVPSRIQAGAWKVVNATGMDNQRMVRSGPIPLSLDVLRQTGEYTRLMLPGEPGSTPVSP